MHQFTDYKLNNFLNQLEDIINSNDDYRESRQFNKGDIRNYFFALLNGNISVLIQSLNMFLLLPTLYPGESFPSTQEEFKEIVLNIADKFNSKDKVFAKSLCRIFLFKQPTLLGTIQTITFQYYISIWSVFESSIRVLFNALYPSKSEQKRAEILKNRIKKITDIIGEIEEDKKERLYDFFEIDYPYTNIQGTILNCLGDKEKQNEYEKKLMVLYNLRNSQHGGGIHRDGQVKMMDSFDTIIDDTKFIITVWKDIIDKIEIDQIISPLYESEQHRKVL